VDLSYQVGIEDFNEWWWAMPIASAIVSGIGIGIANIDDSQIGYTLGYGGGAVLLGTLIYCIVGQLRQKQETKFRNITIGTKLDGYAPKATRFQIPNNHQEVNLLLSKEAASGVAETSPKPASGPGPRKPIIAVFDVQDTTGKTKKEDLLSLTNYLGTVLTKSGKYKTVPRDQLRKRLFETKKGTYKNCFNESCQIELGKALAAQKSLATTLIRVGSKCAVTANLIDLKTETAEKGASVTTGCSTDELLDAMEKLVEQL
jgi:hypothetical protein